MEKTPRFQISRHKKDPNWLRLDNAGKLYPALISRRQTTIFRISVTTTDRINVNNLQRALDRVMSRFPYFRVNLRRGLFWYFFETSETFPRLQPDSPYPCMNMPIRRQGHFPFRVTAYKKRISVEFSHVLTDGTGALSFLKSLLGEYLCLQGFIEKVPDEIHNSSQQVPDEESDDAFRKYYNPHLPLPQRGGKAFHLPGAFIRKGRYLLTTGIIPVDAIKKKASEKGLTITEFLIAHQLFAFQSISMHLSRTEGKRILKPIRISIPVNLRSIFPSKTMRNFFLSVEPTIDPRLGSYTFDEIATKVYHFMRHDMDKRFLRQQITRNIKGEINPVLRMVPLSIKNLVLPLLYRTLAESTYTTGLSNLGRITLPESMQPFVERFDFIPTPSPGSKVKSAVVSYNDYMYITFGRLTEDPLLERFFFTGLRKAGIPVKIETNE